MNKETKELIKDAISKYCEGIVHVEFNINDLDKMVDDIEKIVNEDAKKTFPTLSLALRKLKQEEREI